MADLIATMQAIYTFILTQFSIVFSTIIDNPVLYLPVLVGLFSALVFYVIKLVKKMGVRGKRG